MENFNGLESNINKPSRPENIRNAFSCIDSSIEKLFGKLSKNDNEDKE